MCIVNDPNNFFDLLKSFLFVHSGVCYAANLFHDVGLNETSANFTAKNRENTFCFLSK